MSQDALWAYWLKAREIILLLTKSRMYKYVGLFDNNS